MLVVNATPTTSALASEAKVGSIQLNSVFLILNYAADTEMGLRVTRTFRAIHSNLQISMHARARNEAVANEFRIFRHFHFLGLGICSEEEVACRPGSLCKAAYHTNLPRIGVCVL